MIRLSDKEWMTLLDSNRNGLPDCTHQFDIRQYILHFVRDGMPDTMVYELLVNHAIYLDNMKQTGYAAYDKLIFQARRQYFIRNGKDFKWSQGETK